MAVPAVFLGLVELCLRLAGYGYDTHLFEHARIGGKEYLLNQESFSYRFFPPELSRWPSPLMFEPLKPSNTFRIFILGESAAQGDPEPAFGAGRYLRALLRDRYPGKNIEVINVAITAINSHVILPIARECADYQADCWIVYMGNNEMIGPFGAATVFGAKGQPWPVVRLGLAIQKTRTGQLLMNLTRHFKANSTAPAVWGGLQMFLGNELAPDDPRKEVVYKNFERNLIDITRAGEKSGATVLLNTVAVNLADCPPFASKHGKDVDNSRASGCDALCAEARSLQASGDWDHAYSNYASALQLDRQYAEAEYGFLRCGMHRIDSLASNLAALQTHGWEPHAKFDIESVSDKAWYQRICDDDSLCFRADSRINNIIRDTARDFSSQQIRLCDAADQLPQTNKIPGKETFYEHVHFNFDGNYKLALLWARQIDGLMGEVREKTPSWASQQTCENLIGLTDWNRRNVYNAVRQRMERAPLNSQPNNAERLADLSAKINATIHPGDAAAAAAANAIYTNAIAHDPGDYQLHQNYGEFLDIVGDAKRAAQEFHRANEMMPRNPYGCLVEGQLLEKQGAARPAREAFQEAIKLHPRYAEAWRELGKVDAFEGKLNEAMTNYQHAAALQPNDSQTFVYMGKALSLLKRPEDSLRNFRHALELDGSDWEAHYDLGGELGMQGQIAEAKTEFEKTVALRPEFAMGHLNLGVALLKLNQADAAAREFAETLRLDPSNKSASAYLAAAKAAPAKNQVVTPSHSQ